MLRQARPVAIDETLPLLWAPIEIEPHPAVRLHLGAEMETRFAVPAAVGDARGSEAPGRRQEVDRLEQAGLAGSIGPEDEMPPGVERLTGGLEIPKGPDFELGEHLGAGAGAASGRDRQSRMGMMTQT